MSMPIAHTPQPTSASDAELHRDADALINEYLPSNSEFVGGFKPAAASGDGQPPAYEPHLPLPLCLPQISTNFGSSFTRGYNEALQEYAGIPRDDFLKFVDGLNIAITASPPLRVVNMAGMVIGFVPYHWAMIAGAAIQTGAQTAMHILSKSLTDRYVRAANNRIFHPRGLSVRLCTTPAMMALVTGSTHNPQSKPMAILEKVGHGVGGILLKAPIPFSSRIVRAIADPAPKLAPVSHSTYGASNEALHNPSVLRRIAIPGEHALPVNLDVPPPAKPEGVMDVMTNWGVQYDNRKVTRTANKQEEFRRRAARIEAGMAYNRSRSPSPAYMQEADQFPTQHHNPPYLSPSNTHYPPSKADRKAQRREHKAQRRENKDLRRAEKRADRLARRGPGLLGSIIGPKETRLERKVRNADLLEKWASGSVLWIVVMNKEMDGGIAGIEAADSAENEERVDEQEWEDVLAHEEDEFMKDPAANKAMLVEM